MITTIPTPGEYPPYFDTYLKAVPENDLLAALEQSKTTMLQLLNSIPHAKGDYSYAEGKWTVKEVLIHVLDSERIFNYRALCFARNDKTELPGFDEDAYTPNSGADGRSLVSIANEFEAVRASTIALFNSFTDEMMQRRGLANRNAVSVRALGFIIAGHANHHVKVIKERYL